MSARQVALYVSNILKVVFGSYVSLGKPFGPGAFGLIIPVDALKIGNGVTQAYVDAVLDIYLAKLAATFGGFTTLSSGFGGWNNHEGTLIKENVIVVIAFADNATLEQVASIESLARRVRRELYQDCVTAIAYGEAFLVDKG